MWGEWSTCVYPEKNKRYWHNYNLEMNGFSLLKRKTTKQRNLPEWF